VRAPEISAATADRPPRAPGKAATGSTTGQVFDKAIATGHGQCQVKRYNTQLRDLIIRGKAHPSLIVSHELPLDQAPDAYARFDRREDGWTTVHAAPGRVSQAMNLARGMLDGAAGTTALNVATYLDMAARARPASSSPQDIVEKLSEAAGVPVPGDKEARGNRVAGLGPLTGVLAGVGTGAVLGALRPAGLRPGLAVGTLAAGTAPMTGLGITDPRTCMPSWPRPRRTGGGPSRSCGSAPGRRPGPPPMSSR
jgi:hypothetical protein